MHKNFNTLRSTTKRYSAFILMVLIVCFMPTPSNAASGYWQLVYSTDFSNDPGWTTNNSARFYWVASDSTYYMENYQGANEYTYESTTWNSNSFKIIYDINLTQEEWGSHLGLGLYDESMSVSGHFLEAHFGHDDGGKEVCIHFRHAGGYGYEQVWEHYQLNTWYTFELIYDKTTNTASLTVTDRGTGIEFCSFDCPDLGAFIDLSKIGFTSVGTTPYYTTFRGKIDNVYYYNWNDYVPATIDIDPNTLNLKSHGRWVTCYTELLEGYSVEDIDLSSVAIIAIDGDAIDPLYREGPTDIGDYDNDGIPDLMVKFNRQNLTDILSEMVEPPVYVELEVGGMLVDSVPYSGIDTIRVIRPGHEHERYKNRDGKQIAKLCSIHPNPFRKKTEIRYQIPETVDSGQKSVVSIRVYDATGRMVRQWDEPTLRQSDHIFWDGTDWANRRLSNGVYFIELRTEGYHETRKLMLMR